VLYIFRFKINTLPCYTVVLVLGIGITGGQYYWISGALFGIVLTLYVFISAGGETVRIEAGTHRYPFTFQLPSNVPSSFEGEYGYVRYTAEAKMDRPWKFDHVTRSAFTVISLVDLNLEPYEFRVRSHMHTTQFCRLLQYNTIQCRFL